MPLVSRSAIKPPSSQESLTPQAQTRWDLVVGAIALGVVLIDQFTKHLIVAYFSAPHAPAAVPIFGKILALEYTGNKGAAFSSFTQSPGLLAFLILVAVGVIGWLYWSTRPRNNPWLKATFGLIIGGAAGNLIDRVRLGYVVDFIHFQIPAIGFDFAIFNLADAAISVGVVLLALIFWTLPREHEPDAALASESTGAGARDAASTSDAQVDKMAAKAIAVTTTPATNLPVKAATATKTPTAPAKSAAGAARTATTPVKTPAPGVSKPASAAAAPVARAAVTSRPSSKSKRKRR
jgi:signal peptidase II